MKVLMLCASLDGGGVDKLLYDFSTRIINNDPNCTFDFVVTAEDKGMYEDALELLGCKIFHVKQMSDGLFEYIEVLRKIMIRGRYDIIHDHMNQASMGSLIAAKLAGVHIRIAHAHTYIPDESIQRKIKRKGMAFVARIFATNLCACSVVSAKWLWGEKAKVKIINNAIDIDRYRFSEEKRLAIRKKMNIDDCFVIGNVARFSSEKNHVYMLEILKEIKKTQKTKLLLVGRGVLEQEIRDLAYRWGLLNDIVFMGLRSDVCDLLNAMDVFILPSKYEGFPLTLVEAQANGLPIIASDKISDEIKLSNNFKSLPITASPSEWAAFMQCPDCKRCCKNEIVEKYDISNEAKNLLRYYYQLMR